MRVVCMSLVLLGLTLTGACTDPRPPDDGQNGPKQCTVGDSTLVLPNEEATLAGGGAPDLSCIGSPTAIAEGAAVVLEGCVDVFGLGGEAKRGIRVAAFRASQDPKSDVPEFGETEIALADDGEGLACDGGDASEPACLADACDKNGYYRLSDVASNIPVILKVYAPEDEGVVDTYSFGLVFLEADAVDGAVFYDASVIYAQTYFSIPTLGAQQVEGSDDLQDGVGRGVIAGEVHDCGDRIVKGASVTSSGADASSTVRYFDGDPTDPSPDLSRLTTNDDGLYVMLNAATASGASEHIITAGIADPDATDQCLSLASRVVRTYPDSVSIVTLRGELPQLP